MLRVVTQATQEPISLVEARFQIKDDIKAFDAMLPTWITAAREIVERQSGYALAIASYEWTPEDEEWDELPLLPATATSDDDEYPILFTTEPGPVPAALKAAILMIVADLKAHAEANYESELKPNPAVQNLIFPFCRVRP